MNTKNDVRQLVDNLMVQFGLDDWSFQWNRRKRGRGLCSHNRRTIFLSVFILGNELADIENTIRHEIAHALVGPDEGHGPVWRAMAVRCGARPERCGIAMEDAKDTHKWEIVCNGCNTVSKRHRLTRKFRLAVQNECVRCTSCHSKKFSILGR